MTKKNEDYLCLAVDNISEKKEIDNLIQNTSNYFGTYKIGFEQFIRFGPDIIEMVKMAERRVFLDLKLHDIPNTVKKAVISACGLGVDYLTLHTSGGRKMLEAASDAVSSASKPPLLLGVTVLTSLDREALNSELRVPGELTEQVSHLAKLAVEGGLNGIVMSADDLPEIDRAIFPDTFEIVTPGIRIKSGSDDQKRVTTPSEAVKRGATLLVIGRPVNSADNPETAASEFYKAVSSL